MFKPDHVLKVTWVFEGYSFLPLNVTLKSEKLFSPRFWILYFYGWGDSVYKRSPLIKAYLKKRLFIFRHIFAMPLWLIYPVFSYLCCLTFLPEDLHSVFFWNLEGEKLIFICLFVQQRTKSKLLFSPFPQRGWDHVGHTNKQMKPVYSESQCPDSLKWATLGAVQHLDATWCHVLRGTSCWCGSNQILK